MSSLTVDDKKQSIDIFIPYWGSFYQLKEAVDSVLAQTYPHWKLTIVDDCYPDTTAMEVYAKHTDNRIKYVRHKRNIGITNNFNYCVSNASSLHCVIMGCDDRMKKNYLEEAISSVGECAFYHPGVVVVNKDGAEIATVGDSVKRMIRPRRPGIYKGQKLATSLCIGNWLYFPAILWKTEVIKRHMFNADYKVVEDLDLEQKVILDNGDLYLDNAETFEYRRTEDSVSSKEKQGVRFVEERLIYSLLAKEFKQRQWYLAWFAARLRVTSRLNKLLSAIQS